MTATAMSLPKICTGGDKGGVGGNGRLREGTQAGEEGQGNNNNARHHRSPKFLSTTGGGMCNPHAILFPLIYPPVIGGIIGEGGGISPTHHPPFNFIYPHGGFFFASLMMMGAACELHAAPFYFLFCFPPQFPWVMRQHVTHTPPLFHFVPPIIWEGVSYSPPLFIGGILSIMMGQCITHMLPTLNFIYSLIGGVVLI